MTRRYLLPVNDFWSPRSDPKAGVEIALIRLSGLSKKLSGQVDRPAEVIRRTSR